MAPQLRLRLLGTPGVDGPAGWAQRYERDIDDGFETQDALASDVLQAVRPHLLRLEASRFTEQQRTVHTAMSIAAASAISPAGTACRVFLMPTAPK